MFDGVELAGFQSRACWPILIFLSLTIFSFSSFYGLVYGVTVIGLIVFSLSENYKITIKR